MKLPSNTRQPQSAFAPFPPNQEAASRESAMRLALVEEISGVGMWDYEPDSGTLTWDNAMFTIFGLSPPLPVPLFDAWRASLLPEDLTGAEAALRSAIAENRPMDTRYRIRRGDGKLRVIQTRGGPYRDDSGSPVRLIGVSKDITDQIQSEHALRDNERFLQILANVIPGMVGYWTYELNCAFANNEYLTWLGKRHEEILGMRMRDLLGAELFHDNEPFILRALDGEAQHFERSLTTADGKLNHTMTHYIPDIDGKQIRGFYELVSDVTELKQTQFQLEELNKALRHRTADAESANAAKSRFLANMSHEIRTPMNAILSFLHLLRRTTLLPQQQDYVEKARIASRSLLNILNDILDFSKIEAGRMELETTSFRPDELLRTLEVFLSPAVLEKDIKLLFRIDAALPRILWGDALKLQQILLNLAGNAVKFTQQGQVVVSMRSLSITSKRAEVEFSVKDTGIGIPADKLDSIFEGFVQAESSTTRRFGGSGLGLAISRRLVRLMGGELRVESTPDEGSTFHFTVGFAQPDNGRADDEPRHDFHENNVREGRLLGMRLLVVEDNRLNREVALELLSQEGARVDIVPDGLQGIDAITSASPPFDAVLMDIHMPDMDGYAVTRRIRELPAMMDLPIIAITANALSGNREKCIAAGMNDHLPKPIEIETLITLLRHHCRGFSAARSLPEAMETEYPGFDPQKALARLGNNRSLYARLIREFAVERTRIMERVRGHMRRGRLTVVADELHTIKGVAATLGATTLSRYAAKAESTLRTGSEPATHDSMLRGLEQQLCEAGFMLRRVADELDPPRTAVENRSDPEPTVDRKVLATRLAGLEKLLRSGNMRAIREYEQIRQLCGNGLRNQLMPMDEAIKRLNFPAAAGHCQSLRERFA